MSGSWNYTYGVSDNLVIDISGTYFNNGNRYAKEVRYYTLGDEREFCEYCHGYTKTNNRGNCIACGAPKKPQGYIYA